MGPVTNALSRGIRLATCSVVVALGCSAAAIALPAAAGADTQPSHFIWTSPASGNFTLINNGATNGQPDAILFVTPNAKPNGVCGCVSETLPVGVFYDASASQWAIFYEQSGVSVQAGVSFNVLVVPSASSTAFTVTSGSSNTSGDSTAINSSATNGQPTAILQVTQNGNPGGGGVVYHNEVPGVWYNGSQWAVFNESGDAMPNGVSYNVLVGATSSAGGKAKTLISKKSLDFGNAVMFNNPVTNGDSNAFVLDTPNWNPNGVGGKVDKSQTNVLYGGANMVVENADNAPMTAHQAFNLLYWNS